MKEHKYIKAFQIAVATASGLLIVLLILAWILSGPAAGWRSWQNEYRHLLSELGDSIPEIAEVSIERGIMEYRQLGNSGVRVSTIGMGTNQFGNKVEQTAVNNIIAAAQDLGINFIDTADVYASSKSEETLGNALKGHWQDFVVATKVYFKKINILVG